MCIWKSRALLAIVGAVMSLMGCSIQTVKEDPIAFIRAKRTGGEDPHLPPLVRVLNRGSSVSGTYNVCVSGQGNVEAVKPLKGIMGADDDIVVALKTWTFEPQTFPFCFNQELNFVQIE